MVMVVMMMVMVVVMMMMMMMMLVAIHHGGGVCGRSGGGGRCVGSRRGGLRQRGREHQAEGKGERGKRLVQKKSPEVAEWIGFNVAILRHLA